MFFTIISIFIVTLLKIVVPVLIPPLISYLCLTLIRWLASESPQEDFQTTDPEKRKKLKEAILFATVSEGRARMVEWNKKFHHSIMNKLGSCHKGELPGSTLSKADAEYWDIVPDKRPSRKYNLIEKYLLLPHYQGLYYIGLPGTAKIPWWRFPWIAWGNAKKDGAVSTTKSPITHDELISHLLVQPDVYYVKVSAAETKEGVPIDIHALLTLEPRNTYKPRYSVQNWLEAITNQAEAKIRQYVGSQDVLQMVTVDVDENKKDLPVKINEEAREKIEQILKDQMSHVETEYGVRINFAQIQSVDIAGEDAKLYRDALTVKFTAKAAAEKLTIETVADANRILQLGNAESERLKSLLQAILLHPRGAEIIQWLELPKMGNLGTLVIGNTGLALPIKNKE